MEFIQMKLILYGSLSFCQGVFFGTDIISRRKMCF